jgi:hypothetical protein
LKEAVVAGLSGKIASDAGLRVLYPGGHVTGKWLAHKKNWKGIEDAVARLANASV